MSGIDWIRCLPKNTLLTVVLLAVNLFLSFSLLRFPPLSREALSPPDYASVLPNAAASPSGSNKVPEPRGHGQSSPSTLHVAVEARPTTFAANELALQSTALDYNLAITPSLISALHIAADEQAQLEKLLRAAAARRWQLEQTNAELVRADDGISIRIFTSGAPLASINDELRIAIASVLGDRRGQVFSALTLNELFFSTADRETLLSFTEIDGKFMRSVKYVQPNGDTSEMSHSLGSDGERLFDARFPYWKSLALQHQ